MDPDQKDTQPKVNSSPKRFRIVNIILIVLIILLILGGGYFYYTTVMKSDNSDVSVTLTTIPTPTAIPSPTPTAIPTAATSPIAGWKTYVNTKYNYSFKYPPDYAVTTGCKTTSCIMATNGGDTVTLQGDISTKGWPLINITHNSSAAYNPPANTNLLQWLPQQFPWTKDYLPKEVTYLTLKDGHLFDIIDLTIPKSPQAYSSREIYYLQSNLVFSVQMQDVDTPAAQSFYNNWVSTFNPTGPVPTQ